MASVIKSWVFKSKSNPNAHPHETIMMDDGVISCNCRGWTIKRSGRERSCKHTRMVETGMADSVASNVWVDSESTIPTTQAPVVKAAGQKNEVSTVRKGRKLLI